MAIIFLSTKKLFTKNLGLRTEQKGETMLKLGT